MAELRLCEQCGAEFVPRREHARFCSARCRSAWNAERTGGDSGLGLSALRWSVRSMHTAVRGLDTVRKWDRSSAFAAIEDAVWGVTIVDAALVRHHHAAYDRVLANQPAPQQPVVEGVLAGLRFVRNQIARPADLAPFVDPGRPAAGSDADCLTDWRWRVVPEPVLASLSPRAQAWELGRYRGYEEQLAEHSLGGTFGPVVALLERTAVEVGPTKGVSTLR